MLKKFLPLAVLAACAPDIAQDPPPPAGAIIVQFDPGAAVPVVPLPNDLAKDPTTGKIVVPAAPNDTPAQTEFNRDYLGQLDGFPHESTAEVLVTGPLKPESVNPQTVLAIDTATGQPVAVTPAFDGKGIVVPPPAGGWLRGKRYAIAVVGGASGVRGANNEDVIGSETWTLVSSKSPLVTCEDLKTDCKLAVDVIPSHLTDPADRLADQLVSAKKLEQIRRGYAPLLDALTAKGLDRALIPIVWTFSIVDAGEMTFDPAESVIPFPNDVLRTGKDSAGKPLVALPNPATGKPLTAADCAAATETKTRLYCGLNTLDGFSTLAPLISENSDTAGALQQGTIDAATLSKRSVGLARLASTGPLKTDPSWTPCLNCTSSPNDKGAPQTSPQQLQWKLDAPLDEKTTYFGYVTTDVKDDKGKNVIPSPSFALLRSTQPLVDAAGKSTVSVISDEQAKQLEPIRLGFKPAFDGLEAAGVKRATMALGFPFTTQSESTVLDQLAGFPTLAKAAGLPDYPIAVQDATATYQAIAGGSSIPVAAIGKFYAGVWYTPMLVTGPGGTFNPDPTKAKVQPVRFVMSVPLAAPPAGGYPVTIFGHGFTRGRNDFLSIANGLAQAGQVVISTDVYLHGDRTSCTDSKLFTQQASDDAACATPATMKCDGGAIQGLCVLRDDTARAACAPTQLDPLGDGVCALASQGRCAADGKCQGATADLARTAGLPQISGLAIFNLANFFAMRDGLRQQVIDLAQLVAILKSTDTKKIGNQIAQIAGAPLVFDTTKLGYVGQSLGGIQGTLFNSVSPDTTNVVLNVPGGSWTSLVLNTVSFASLREALLAGLAAQKLLPGTPAFDQFLNTIQWILDPADPANMAYRLTHPVDVAGVKAPNVNRKAFVQFIEGDEAVPNVSTFALLAGANRTFAATPPSFGCVAPLFCYEFKEGVDFAVADAPTAKRHGFLLAPPTATLAGLTLTGKAQTQAVKFLSTGSFQ